MADEKQVATLHESAEKWNAWRAENPGVAIDLPYARLHRANLPYANLHRANLHRANLHRADLSGANLSGANLDNADLIGANLSGADLSNAILHGAGLHGARLSGARLSGANLSDAGLSDADFGEAILGETGFINVSLQSAQGLEACRHLGPSIIDHRTLEKSGTLPLVFLRGCGLPERLIDYLPSLLNQAIEFYSCFISYSHDDKAFARRLHDQLQGRGIRCWLDEHQVLPGDDMYEQVNRGIKLWDKVLLCCSEASLTSWWVDNEIDTVFDKEQKLMKARKEKVLALVPLNLDGYLFGGNWKGGMRKAVTSRLAADFTGWETDNNKFETAFELVVKALHTNDSGREAPPASKL